VAVGSPVTGIQVGLEALCATDWLNPNVEDRFVYVIAHEYVHVQQAQALADKEQPTVLERSLIEGAAEFVAEQIAGGIAYSQVRASAEARAMELATAFVSAQDNTDLSDWLDNSTLERSGALGYWVGYRIVKAYYQHATDKRLALRNVREMTDPRAFLAESGSYPGIHLP
jgi:uncharacterized protein YjaZ